MSTPASKLVEQLEPPPKFRKLSGPPPLMDRSGIMNSCFIRSPENRGKMPIELIGCQYKQDLTALLHRTVDLGHNWENPTPELPEVQIQQMLSAHENDAKFEPTVEEQQTIEFYIKEEIQSKDVEQMPAAIWERALAKTGCKFTSDSRLQSLLVWLRRRAESDWERGSREALLREALRDQWQLQRLALRRAPPTFPHLVATGPAPWRASFLAAKRFCAASLMPANTIVISMLPIWNKMLENLEFLPVEEISANRPFYLYELEEKVSSALDEARKTILRFIFRCAAHMWVQQKKWEHLVSREHGVSADLVRLFNCITSLVGSRLRAKTLASVNAWSQLVLSFKDDGEAMKPLIKFKVDAGTQQLGLEQDRARQFIATTLLRIHEVTQQLPSVGTIMFNPNHKYENPCT